MTVIQKKIAFHVTFTNPNGEPQDYVDDSAKALADEAASFAPKKEKMKVRVGDGYESGPDATTYVMVFRAKEPAPKDIAKEITGYLNKASRDLDDVLMSDVSEILMG